MKLHLKKLNIYRSSSKESNCFDADIYYGNKKIGWAFNSGSGGETNIQSVEWHWMLFEQAKKDHENMPPQIYEVKGVKYSFPMTLQRAIDNLVKDHIQEDYRKKSMTKLDHDILRGLCYKHQETDSNYNIVTWGNGKWPIEKMLKNKIMRSKLLDKLTQLRIDKMFILNTNLSKY